jgi:DNA (cytosine-5)-methyltransferase 1
LHPSEHRAISAREAALLQTFPMDYEFPTDATKTKIALMIGNALPPEFCRLQAKNILDHLVVNYG